MDVPGFTSSLERDGYQNIETRERTPNDRTPDHSHPYDVRALVLAGEITLTWNGMTRSFTAGEVFTMDGDCKHTEVIGPEGLRVLVGRRPR